MQFNVPQFIEIEDKIIGPLTLKQFMYLAIGGAICFMLYFVLKVGFFIVVTIIVMGFCAMLAFLKINGRPFPHFLKNFVSFALRPKIYVWQRKAAEDGMVQW